MSAVSVSQSGVRPILADAVDVARRALLELEPSGVGAHLGVTAEDETAATHRFEATLAGYRGWQWAVVVAAPPGAQYATVSESALLPGPDALVAPDFVPWEQRIRPGDLAPGDLLAPPADDPRLVPGYVASGDPAVDEVALEIGLGRTKVLSREGRAEAADRWYSEYGPETDMAKAAPSTCGRCGFYLPLAGALRSAFGVCGNAMGADGHVVHAEYGCGAHSDVEAPTGGGSPLYEAYDDAAFDVIPMEAPRKSAEAASVAETGADTSDAETAVEPSTPEPPERAASASTGAVASGSVESSVVASGDVAEPDVSVAHGVSVPGATGAHAETVEDLTGDVAESIPVEPGIATSTESPSAVDSDTADLPRDPVAASGTSGEPDVVAPGVPDMSSAAGTFSPAADVVAEPSAVIERAADAADVDTESISGAVSRSDAAQGPADSTTDPSLTRAAEPNSAAGESAVAVPTADSARIPTAAEASAEAAVSEPDSGTATGSTAAGGEGVADTSSTAAAFGPAADVATTEPSAMVDLNAESVASHAATATAGAASVPVSVESGAVVASGIERVAESGADVVEAESVATEPSNEVTGARPESDAAGTATFAGEADIAGRAASDVHSADPQGVSADADAGTAGADGEMASADSASADADGGVAGTDGGVAAVPGLAADVDGAAADDDFGHADNHGEGTGTHGAAGDAAGGGPGAAARPEFGSSLQG